MKKSDLLKPSLSLLLLLLLLISCKKEKAYRVIKSDHSKEIKALIKKADSLYFAYNYEGSYKNYNKAFLLCDPNLDPQNYAYLLSSMADIQSIYGDYLTSEVMLTKTLPYLKKIKKTIIVRNIYSYIGINYYNMYNYSTSIFYHTKALKLPGAPYRKSLILNDIAAVYTIQGRYKEVVNLLEPLAAKKIINTKHPKFSDASYALTLTTLGYSYFKLNKPGAIELLQKSLIINLAQNDIFNLIINYKYLSMCLQKTNPKLAQEYALKSYSLSAKMASATEKANSLAQVIKVTNSDELKTFSKRYIKIIDSIAEGRRKTRSQFENIKYTFNEDKAENLELKSQKIQTQLLLERQKNRNLILYIIIVCIFLILVFVLLYFYFKSKKENKDTSYETERRISNKLHGELSNQVLSLFNTIQNVNIDTPSTKESLLISLDQIYNKARKISKENSTIQTDESFLDNLKEMISGYANSNLNIIINSINTISWSKIDRIKKITLYRILQELLDHTKSLNEASLLSITFKKSSKNIELFYIDNSHGITNENIILEKRLQNVENRIKTIKGTLNFDKSTKGGFKISFTFPI